MKTLTSRRFIISLIILIGFVGLGLGWYWMQPPLIIDVTVEWGIPPLAEPMTTYPELNTIIVGKVLTVTRNLTLPSDWLPTGKLVFSDWTVAVSEYLIRPLPQTQLVVRLPGGTADGTTYHFNNGGELIVGETVVLFLTKADTEGPYMLLWGTSGVFYINNGRAKSSAEEYELGELKELIATAAQNISAATPSPVPPGAVLPTATPAP